jgi:hypothetical protein
MIKHTDVSEGERVEKSENAKKNATEENVVHVIDHAEKDSDDSYRRKTKSRGS